MFEAFQRSCDQASHLLFCPSSASVLPLWSTSWSTPSRASFSPGSPVNRCEMHGCGQVRCRWPPAVSGQGQLDNQLRNLRMQMCVPFCRETERHPTILGVSLVISKHSFSSRDSYLHKPPTKFLKRDDRNMKIGRESIAGTVAFGTTKIRPVSNEDIGHQLGKQVQTQVG